MINFKSRKNIVGLSIVYIGLVIIALFAYNEFFAKEDTEESLENEFHIHAGVQFYQEGALLDFSNNKFMHLEPCTNDSQEESEDELGVHLHNGIGDVVHIHKDNTVWRDAYTYLQIESEEPNISKIYVDGESVTIENFLNSEIKDYQRVVFVLGDPLLVDEALIFNNMVTEERIKQLGALSESCGISS